MTGRKIGVGFNHPRVLDGRMQFDWRRRYDFMRRLTRLQRNRRRWWDGPIAASAVEVHRLMMRDKA